MKPFDPTQPHTHYCSNWRCRKPVHCRAANCDIPRFAECMECRQAHGYSNHDKDLDAVETYTLPFGARRNRRRA